MWYNTNTVTKDFACLYSIFGYSSQCHLLYYSLHFSRKHRKVNVPIIHCSLSFGNCKNFSFSHRKCYLSGCLECFVYVCGFFFLFSCPTPPKSEHLETNLAAFNSVVKEKSYFKFYMEKKNNLRFLSLNRSLHVYPNLVLFGLCEHSAIE